jgi:hypothetical protein
MAISRKHLPTSLVDDDAETYILESLANGYLEEVHLRPNGLLVHYRGPRHRQGFPCGTEDVRPPLPDVAWAEGSGGARWLWR